MYYIKESYEHALRIRVKVLVMRRALKLLFNFQFILQLSLFQTKAARLFPVLIAR